MEEPQRDSAGDGSRDDDELALYSDPWEIQESEELGGNMDSVEEIEGEEEEEEEVLGNGDGYLVGGQKLKTCEGRRKGTDNDRRKLKLEERQSFISDDGEEKLPL